MLRFLLTRLSLIIPTFIGMTLLAFFLIRLVPGDPIETLAGERGIDAARHAQLLKEYGLDQPVLVQYGSYIGRVLHGDLGKSIITQEPVLREFLTLFPATGALVHHRPRSATQARAQGSGGFQAQPVRAPQLLRGRYSRVKTLRVFIAV